MSETIRRWKKDFIEILDELRLVTRDKAGNLVRELVALSGKELVQIDGHFSCHLRERGKIVPFSRRQGHNIVTLTGREFDAGCKSYETYVPLKKKREDGVRYIGFGTGVQPEVSTVSRLVQPIAFDSLGNFLAPLSLPTYPLNPTLSAVRYSRSFSENELSVAAAVILTEAGLFTDGSPTASPAFDPGTRDTTLAAATQQAPITYKAFEPLEKTQAFVLEASWELRH